MRNASPDALRSDIRPALVAHLGAAEFENVFRVDFQDLDPFDAAEPSRAALVRLDSGKLIVVEYGLSTSTLTVSVPEDADVNETVCDLLQETGIDTGAIDWLVDEILPESPFLYDNNSLSTTMMELRRRTGQRRGARESDQRSASQQMPLTTGRKP